MTIDRARNHGSETPAQLLAMLTGSPTLAETLSCGARVLARLAGAEAAAVYAVTPDGIAGETRRATGGPVDPVEGERLREAAQRILPAGETVGPDSDVDLSPAGAGGREAPDEPGIHAFALVSGSETIGAAAMNFPDAAPWADPIVETAIGVLTARLASHLDRLRLEAQEQHYERWFRVQDEQIRILDRERQKFATVVNQTEGGVIVVDAAGRITWTNRVVQTSFPLPPGLTDWVGQPGSLLCRTMQGERGGPETSCPIEVALSENRVIHREVRLETGDGTLQLYVTAVPIKGPDGKPSEVIVTVQDLSNLDVVRKSERRYRVLFEESVNALLLVDPASWRVVMGNASAGRLLGCAAKELAESDLGELLPASDRPRIRRGYEDTSGGRAAEGTECRLTTRDGRERVANVYVQRFEMDDRELMMLEVHDITERRRAEEALRAAETRLQMVVANSPLVLFAMDRELRFTLSEGKGLAALGLERGQVVGMPVDDVYRDHPRVLAAMRRALAGEEYIDVLEVGELTFETWLAPIRGESGEITGVVGVATDVTQSRELEKQLRHSQRMQAIGRLAGGVAHDFNNLLTVILGHCDLMLRQMAEDDRWVKDTEAIQKAGTRGSLLARQLLAFSRREVVAPEPLDLGVLVRDVEPMLKRLIGEDIAITVRLPGQPAMIKADRGQIEQILMNLVVNSRDAMPTGGAITIQVAPLEAAEPTRDAPPGDGPGGFVTLTVVDTGCGMDEVTLENLFDPFYTTKPVGEGTGLGMSIVYGIVQQYDGRIEADSEPGAGTTIRVTFPRYAEEAGSASPEPDDLHGPEGRETILVVEDEDEVRTMIAEVLESSGYTVFEAAGAEEAFSVCTAEDNAVDLVLTDVIMPGHSGGELATWLSERMPDLRLMFMSGYTDDTVVRSGAFSRGNVFLQKPFRLSDLLHKVREALDSDPPRADEVPRTEAA